MSANDYLLEGANLLRAGNLHKADEVLSGVLRIAPDNHLALFLKGLTAKQAGNTELSIDLIRKAISISPEIEAYHEQLGNILFESNRMDEAIISYRRAAGLNPQFSRTFVKQDLLQYLHSPGAGNIFSAKGPFCCFSCPKAGTHLLADIVQKITGLSVFWPETAELSLDILQGIPTGYFLTGHFTGSPAHFNFYRNNRFKIIFNYRDPRDQLVSFYFYYREIYKNGDNEWGHLLRRFNKEQAINYLINTFPARLANWLNDCLELARMGIPGLFITYEELINNKFDSIRRIAKFLGYDLSNDRINIIISETSFDKPSITLQKKGEPDSHLKRKGIAGDWRNHFTQANKETFNSVAGRLLAQLGYEIC
ncbi:MAG: tetratricopeptide repeat protein [Deferribacteres bacterium]|nr:tetratricopeptide repeat protein [Deferribacteres bacterium]